MTDPNDDLSSIADPGSMSAVDVVERLPAQSMVRTMRPFSPPVTKCAYAWAACWSG